MNQYVYQRRPVDNSAIPTVIFWLLIANGLVFALQQFSQLGMFALWPLGSGLFMPWQVLTYGFLHGGVWHIFFNMFALWMFGRDLERIMGAKRFLIYYLTCVVGAAVVQLVVAMLQGGIYPTIGASGGVFGILLAYGMAFPNNTVMLLFPPIPMKAKYFVIVFGALELFLGVAGTAPGVAHFAHLGGMLFGWLLLRYWRRPRTR
ncbi:MAG TPA: rhomboid family intramembrane serine protease [Woeseiaceae bacterium]